jgi:Flp pilus assembly protein TadD
MNKSIFITIPGSTSRPLTSAWLALSVAAFGAVALFLLLLVLSRAPLIAPLFVGKGALQGAAGFYVNLAASVWLLAFAGLAWSLVGGGHRQAVTRLAFWLAAVGALTMAVAAFMGSGKLLAGDAAAVLGNPVFLGGAAAFIAGHALLFVRALLFALHKRAQPVATGSQWALHGLALGALAVAVAMATRLAGRAGDISPEIYYGVAAMAALAFMTVGARLLPRLGFARFAPASARRPMILFGLGLVSLGAGGLGNQASLMALGGLLVLAGGMLFLRMMFLAAGPGCAGQTAAALLADGWTERRPMAAALTVSLLVAGVAVVSLLPKPGLLAAGQATVLAVDPGRDPAGHAAQARRAELELRFAQGVSMLHAKQYGFAATAWHRVLELAPKLPEAHVNMGFTMLGLERYDAAADFFSTAIELRPMQANAYYGLAETLDALHDRHGALGAMRTYLHLAAPDDPFVRKAQSAVWEWEAALAKEAGPLRTPTRSGAVPQIPRVGK